MIGLGLSKMEIATKMQSYIRDIIIFHNFIPHKIKKFDYKTPEWMNKSMKKRPKVTKRYHSNLTANNKEVLDFQAKEREIYY